jgi:hypothetical protein
MPENIKIFMNVALELPKNNHIDSSPFLLLSFTVSGKAPGINHLRLKIKYKTSKIILRFKKRS